MVELETFGFVHGQEMDAVASRVIGRGRDERQSYFVCEFTHGGETAAGLILLEQVKKVADAVPLNGVCGQSLAPEQVPGGFDQIAKSKSAMGGDDVVHDGDEALQVFLRHGRKCRYVAVLLQGVPDRFLTCMAVDGMEIGGR